MTDELARPKAAQNTFEELLGAAAEGGTHFATAFRGYDKDEVDETVRTLSARLKAATDEVSAVRIAQEKADRSAQSRTKDAVGQAESDLAKARAALTAAEAKAAGAQKKLRAELAAAEAKAADAQQKVQALTEELTGSEGESDGRRRFEEILRVAEDQAGVLIRNAAVQGDRLLESAREEVQNRRKEAAAEAEAITSKAEHDAQQARLKIETELTAHQAQIEREAAHAAEKVAQADQEAAAIRTGAEKGVAALRSTVARETTHARAEAEETVNELRMRALEFEESLTRRQDDAQQEFLMLHNQAVAHAERITQDANDQVTASLEHAQRVASKADDFEKLMRAQAQQIEADANLRARELTDRARAKAEKIIETVTTHSTAVLRDAEDRTRQLRWQQQQLTSFMTEVKELVRPETPLDDSADAEPAEAQPVDAEHTEPVERAESEGA